MRSSIVSLAMVLARLAAAQDNSSIPTINMFVDDGLDGDESYAASIVCAGASETIYAIRCTDEGTVDAGSATCGPDAEVFTLTANPSTYVVATATSTEVQGYEVTGSVAENCALLGTTAADCTATVSLSVDGTSTALETTVTLSGTDYHRFDVAITGGAEKTAVATGECGSAASGAVGRGLKTREGWVLGTVVVGGALVGVMVL
ncbi:hypothetical protein diail_2030 [Diaporthe ilicicola]|nr:hypothetical protein diail_2030 [Diaporthe ilicicola]